MGKIPFFFSGGVYRSPRHTRKYLLYKWTILKRKFESKKTKLERDQTISEWMKSRPNYHNDDSYDRRFREF